MGSGQRSFILRARFPGSRNPTRRAIATHGELTLEKARDKARRWIELLSQGKDPALEIICEGENTFGSAVEDYIRLVVVGTDPENPKQLRGKKAADDLRRVFVTLWGTRPVTGITRNDVRVAIENIRDCGTGGLSRRKQYKARKVRSAPEMARILLAYLKTFFSWAIERGTYGLEASPCDHLQATRIIGRTQSRDRILSDDELFALWRATTRLAYPYRETYQLLARTALRLNECAGASWPEFDLAGKLWTIPARRMKGTNGRARAHAVPLTPRMMKLLESLPRLEKAEFLFSTTLGEKQACIGSWIKRELDKCLNAKSWRAVERDGLAKKHSYYLAQVALYQSYLDVTIRRCLR